MESWQYGRTEFVTPRMTRAVKWILLVTIGIWVAVLFSGRRLETGWYLVSLGLDRDLFFDHRFYWQIVTYVFLHVDFWHIFFNMLALYFLGCEMERAIGTARFLTLYLISGVLGGLGWILISDKSCIGASGAVFGVLGAFAALFPRRQITLLVLLIFPITFTARTLVLVLGLFSLLAAVYSNQNDVGIVAHAVHLAGGVAGYLYGLLLARKAMSFAAYEPYGSPGWFRRLGDRLRNTGGRVASVFQGSPPSQAEIDRILDKMLDKGLNSLTWRERRMLARAGRRRR